MAESNPAVRKNSAFKYNPIGLAASGLSKGVVNVGKFIGNGLFGAFGGIKSSVGRPVGTNNVSILTVDAAVNKTPEVKKVKSDTSSPNVTARTEAASSLPTPLNGNTQPENYYFNLPPHQWSIPVRPVDINSLNQKKTIIELGSEVDFYLPTEIEQISAFHGFRRGRVWRYQGLNYDLESTSGDKTTSTTTDSSGKVVKSDLRPLSADKWGFQFLWNPESISISVNLNMDVTPSANDVLRSVVGAFPGMEYVSIKVVLDRTNDFACFKATKTDDLKNFEKYYLNRYPYEFKQDAAQQIKDLSRLGTGADLEYLFKTLNGSGTEKDWANLIGKPTADIGFIQPAIIALQLGPTMDSLSYVGWVDSLSLNHVSFTESMIPLRTEVNFSMRTITGTSIR